jgi:class 3 adenylate cyclase
VFRAFDPIIARDNYFGSSVTRAARIEPITPPGTVFASEAFAAVLAASGGSDCSLEYVGSVGLAKGFGESRVYRLAPC